MNRNIIRTLSLVSFIVSPFFRGYSQVDFGIDHFFSMRESNLRVSALNKYTQIKFADRGSYSSGISVDYANTFGSLGFSANINRNLKFEELPGNLTIVIPDSAIILDKDKIKVRPGYYEIDNPFIVYSTLIYNQFEISLAANILTRNETTENYKLNKMSNNIYYIDFESIETRKFDVLFSGSIGYSWDDAKFFLGFLNVPLLSKGNLNQSSFSIQPLAGVKWSLFNGNSTAITNTKEFRLSHTQPINIPWLWANNTINVSASIKRNFDKYSYQAFSIDAEIPFISNFLLSFGYRQAWGHTDILNRMNFEQWRSSLGNILGDDLIGGLDHSIINMGLSVLLGSTNDEFPLHLINSKIIQKHIYIAKRELYAYNPIGALDIHNSGKHPVRCQISLELPEKLGSYRSESLNIEPDEIKSFPVYLYLSENDIKKPTQYIQMHILMEAEGKKRVLSTIPVTVFDKHSWDGNTWGLKYFITVDEPAVLVNAKKKYIQSYVIDSSLSESGQQFQTLKNFITELGRDMRYVQDPTTTIYIDRVQYPVETINEKTGDCDDFSVYLSAHLMAVGIHCVLVDIKPQPKGIELPTAGQNQIGHIFLLADTGIEVEHAAEIGLKEFQFVSRKSLSGKITAWIPIETTVINQGFDKAFQEGVSQYYKEVIEKDGITNGTVHVYDQ